MNMRLSRSIAALICAQSIFFATAYAQQSSCTIPLSETKSAPAVDLLLNGTPVDHDQLITRLKACDDSVRRLGITNDAEFAARSKQCFDTSTLEPQKSDLYSGASQPLVQYTQGLQYPNDTDTVTFTNSLSGTSGLVRARVVLTSNPNVAYQLNFSLDTHAALARNALLRKLGYTIPSPKYYKKMTVVFKSLDERDGFLDNLADNTLTSRARWVVGGLDELNKNQTTITFQDIVIESAVIDVPQMHWGILVPETINGRRSIRAMLAPLTLLDIPESVNMFSFEPAKIFNEGLSFTRPNADKFKNETSIGDIEWIARKIAKLTREDWTAIIQAGYYPADIQALIVEKTLGRVNQFMSLLGMKDFTPFKYNAYITYGNVVNGKAMQESYDGYSLRFTYGDPQSPLRASELVRFFGIQAISSGIKYGLNKANTYLQAISPDHWVGKHQDKFYNDILDHLQNHPNEPYVQPIEVWGGPIAGANVSASRNIVTGTYYGSESQVQLVDQVSAGIAAGAFIGISGLKSIGVSLTPQLQFSRSYVHVRPLTDIKTAWKDNWKNLYVPHFMSKLAGVLSGEVDQSSADAMKAFLGEMKTGEMFIITDALAAGNSTMVGIPLGALLGVLPSIANITETVTFGNQYALLSRTTIYKSEEGLHVYLSRIHSGTYQLTLDTEFFIKLLSINAGTSKGSAHTKAFIFPDKFDDSAKEKAFQRALGAILRRNNTDIIDEEFNPYELDHTSKGRRGKIQIGPWSWSNRENYHKLTITPPVDPEGKYNPAELVRTVVDGQITKITGSDIYGFFGTLVKKILPFIDIGGSQVGDDPSTNFLGRSKTFAVSTELETTPSRDNHTFMRIQQTHNGWSLRKNKLLKMVDEMTKQLQEFSPNGGLINKDEFAQTKHIQAYTILWSLLVYEKGINRMLNILNLDTMSTKDTQMYLIDVMGKQQYVKYCSDHGYQVGFLQGPYSASDVDGSIVESSKGQNTLVACVTPWMQTVYDLRQTMKRHPEAFNPSVREDDDAQDKIRWVNRAVTRLAKDMDIAELIRMVGKDQSFFQVRVSGFRTKDENGDSQYFSNTVGSVNPDIITGPLSDINDASQIQTNELQARYLSDGY
jgi:hypothetical protein